MAIGRGAAIDRLAQVQLVADALGRQFQHTVGERGEEVLVGLQDPAVDQALELCLSCNVLAEMTQGGFEAHHFGEWVATECPVALSTDDVGVFESALSNEYLIGARAFGLSRVQVVDLAMRGSRAGFAGRERMERFIGRGLVVLVAALGNGGYSVSVFKRGKWAYVGLPGDVTN